MNFPPAQSTSAGVSTVFPLSSRMVMGINNVFHSTRPNVTECILMQGATDVDSVLLFKNLSLWRRAIHECTRELTRTRTCEYFNSQIGTRTRANSFPRVEYPRVTSPPAELQVLTGTHRYLQVHKGEKGPKGMSQVF
jgi:hypothetical protein